MNVDRAPRQTFAPNACADLENLPGESFVSSLWRFSWRNGLDAKTLLPYCSKGVYRNESSRNCFWRYDHERFARASGWCVHDAEAVLLESSHENHRSLWWSRTMRYCPLCLEHLYHSYWHQCEFLANCPFDGAPLLVKCYCCGSWLGEYGFYRRLLNIPYKCSTCGGPISGVEPSIGLRLAMQDRTGELGNTVCRLERWWESLSPARKCIEGLLRWSSWSNYAPELRPGPSLRQWAISMGPAQSWPGVSIKTVPPLVILDWKVRLQAPELQSQTWVKRRWRFERLGLARQVYRTTLRRLASLISSVFPFTETEYRRYLMLPAKDLLVHPRACNVHLLALIGLRMRYESYFSIFGGRCSEHAVLDEPEVGFPYGNDFSERVRICWRAQFIAEYASLYWSLVSMRNGKMDGSSYHGATAALFTADVQYDPVNGDLVHGQVAFPAVDGLPLELFLRAQATTA